MSDLDVRRMRVIRVRPELLAQLLRDGHVCTPGRSFTPAIPMPADLRIVCSHYDHREQLIVLGVHSESFAQVPLGIEPPRMELAFTRGGPPAQAAPADGASS